MATDVSQVRLKTVALPAEHGGWGFLLEPLLLGSLVAPSVTGSFLSLATVAAFLLRHPVKLILHDRRRSEPSRRVPVARKVAAFYAALTATGLVAALSVSGWLPLLPFVLASPFAAVYLIYESKSQGRSLAAEVAAPGALAAAAPAIALAGGWVPVQAAALWVLLIARTVPTILYVRARLRLERGRPSSPTPVIAGHLVALLCAALLAWYELVPALAVLALFLLAGRATHGLSQRRRAATPRRVGLMEASWGSAFVVLCVLGYWSGV